LKDLKERFAKVEIQASEPIVPFRETAIKVPDMQPSKAPNINGVNAPRGTVQGTASNNAATYTVRAIPLPESITTFLQANQSIIVKLEKQSQHESHKHKHPQNGPTLTTDVLPSNGSSVQGEDDEGDDEIDISHGELVQKPTVLLENFWSTFKDICKKEGGDWAKYSNRVWALGPNRIGPNLLVDNRSENERWYVPSGDCTDRKFLLIVNYHR
jgi:ribosome assembly protein 1